MDSELSFLDLLAQLRAGDDAAANAVFHRFAHRLIALARKRLDPMIRTRIDPEDVVQSVFRSFFRRCEDGHFELGGWDNVWHVLACIAVRKCVRKNQRIGRNVAHTGVQNEEALRAAFQREPTPEETVALLDTIEELMRGLEPHERAILTLRLQGSKTREISEELHCTMRKVQRVLQLARERLERLENQDAATVPPS